MPPRGRLSGDGSGNLARRAETRIGRSAPITRADGFSAMQRIETKHAIIGAGAMGSAAAYHLARRGEPVLLLEQFPLGHDRGSSHGAARITRHSYADARYARLMPAAFAAWRELEADAGVPLYLRTGGISLSPAGGDYVAHVAASLEELGVPHRRMTGARVEPDQSRPSPSPRPTTPSSSPTPACSPRPGRWACRSSWRGRTAARRPGCWRARRCGGSTWSGRVR